MTLHRETREFTLRIEFVAEFPESYDGEEDGLAWTSHATAPIASAVRAAIADLSSNSDWKIRFANRGRPSEDEVTIRLEKTF